MIELSITAKSATAASPATPVGARAADGFARTLRTLSAAPDTRPVQSDGGDTRQSDAASGKNLPATGDELAREPAATSPEPHATSTSSRRPVKADSPIALAMIVPATVPPAGPSASDNDALAADATQSQAADDDTTPATPVMAFFIPVPPAAAGPSLPPPAGETAGPGNDAAPGVLALASTSQTATATPVETSDTPETPDAVPAPTSGSTALPNVFQLLDGGAPGPVVTTTSAMSNVVLNPRIVASAETPRFGIAAATNPSVDAAAVTVLPARQAFAAALAALSPKRAAREDDSNDSHDPVGAFAGLVTPTGDTTLPTAVPQVADSQGAALDLRHDRGLRGMIDHIETLRDDANARDTRIRLVPDALGTVDVAVRRDGAAVHVRFSSANEATRAVLTDAQPRLAQLAESRGLSIAGSSVDSGAGGQSQPRTPNPNPTSRPESARRSDAAREREDLTDQRLA